MLQLDKFLGIFVSLVGTCVVCMSGRLGLSLFLLFFVVLYSLTISLDYLGMRLSHLS